MTDFKFGAVKIDPSAYGSQGSAVLGIRDSGKTYTATELAEKLFEAGIPFVAFDPIGVWRFLRVPGHGRGYPVVVAGGQAGDLPLTVASAPEYVRAAMRDGVSLIIDLFDINLSKADWKRIVTACVRVLMHENSTHGLRHVFIEEAAEFAPQRVGPDQGQVYAEIEKLARMGGNSRLGYTLINQRAEEVNKAVLELCDNLFLHRQKGRNSLTALSKWLDIGAVKDHREIIDSLSTLPTGECWAWLAGTERPIRIKVPVKNSLHPDRRVMRGDGDIKVKTAVDVGTFVTSMRSSLGKIEEEAKANDPAALRKRIAELERQIKAGPAPEIDPAAADRAYKDGYDTGTMHGSTKGFDQGYAAASVAIAGIVQGVIKAGNEFMVQLRLAEKAIAEVPRPAAPAYTGAAVTRPRATVTQPAPRGFTPVKTPVITREKPASTNGHARADITRPQQKILDKLAWLESNGIYPAPKETLGAVCNVSPSSSSYQNNLGALRTAGLIDYPQPAHVGFTESGRAAAVLADDDGRRVHEHWLEIVSRPQRAILEALIEAHPDQLSKEALADIIAVSAESSSYQNNLGALRTLGAIDYPAPRQVALTRYVMP